MNGDPFKYTRQTSYGKVISPTDYKGMIDWIVVIARDSAIRLNRAYNAEAEEGHLDTNLKKTATVFSNIAREALILRDTLRGEAKWSFERRADAAKREHSRATILRRLRANKAKVKGVIKRKKTKRGRR